MIRKWWYGIGSSLPKHIGYHISYVDIINQRLVLVYNDKQHWWLITFDYPICSSLMTNFMARWVIESHLPWRISHDESQMEEIYWNITLLNVSLPKYHFIRIYHFNGIHWNITLLEIYPPILNTPIVSSQTCVCLNHQKNMVSGGGVN